MAPPPAKRQKRLVVLSSDNEDDIAIPTKHYLRKKPIDLALQDLRVRTLSHGENTASQDRISRNTSKARGVLKEASAQTSRDSSPPKLAPKAKEPKQEAKSQSLYSFFNRTTQAQRYGPKLEGRPEVTDEVVEAVDCIEDGSQEEDLDKLRNGQDIPKRLLDHRKPHSVPVQSYDTYSQRVGHSSASQKFKKSQGSSKNALPSIKRLDTRPWAEQYGPSSLEELAVHKRKILDVRKWLEDVLQGRELKRLLILKGPSGSGKTATVAALSKALDFDISEWRNPISSDFSSETFVSALSQFEDFLGRSGRFGSLDFTNQSKHIPSRRSSSVVTNTKQSIILLEEFPNTFTRTSSALQSFRTIIMQYLAANTPPFGGLGVQPSQSVANVLPLIIIVSETLLVTSTASADSFTVHRLLGPDILGHPGTSMIEFNPIATTILTKALDLVLQKEARHSGRRRIPGPLVLKTLAEVGDIRSATGSLEFLCLRGGDGADWGGRVASKGKKGSGHTSTLTKMERRSIEMVTQRGCSLGIFHAVGKVVYNKRLEISTTEPIDQPPGHLRQHIRPQKSEVSPEQLIDEIGTDIQTFIAALHENYVLSCEGPGSTDSINDCIEALSDSDILCCDRSSSAGFSGLGGSPRQAGSLTLRQDEMSFQVAVRGLFFGLPYPVKRNANASVNKGKTSSKPDAYKMFYPTSLRVWKQAEEIGGLVEMFNSRYLYEGDNSRIGMHGMRDRGKRLGVEAWDNRSLGAPNADNGFKAVVTCTGKLTHAELLLERLPYMAMIERQNADSRSVYDLERITKFTGLEPSTDGTDIDDDENPTVEVNASDNVTGPRSSSNVGARESLKGTLIGIMPVGEDVQKLVLSDDDIEDD